MTQVLRGNIVHTPKMGELSILEHGCLVLEDGVIQAVCSDLPRELEGAELRDYGDRLLMQSFVDMHLHAPQYPMLGMGMDLQLLDWLNLHIPHGGAVRRHGLRPQGVPAAGRRPHHQRHHEGVHVLIPPHGGHVDLDG